MSPSSLGHSFSLLSSHDTKCINSIHWNTIKMLILFIFLIFSFLQLDLGKLQITNELTWHGSQEKDPSAVHIDLIHAQVHTFYHLGTCN